MKRLPISFRSMLGVTVLVALILAVAWWAGRAGQETSTLQTLSPLAEPISPLVTPTDWLTPTPWILPTTPPFPTPLPTPVVTPIPLASPPFIPELAGKSTEPYQIVIRIENTLWIMNNDGSELRVLFDAVKEAGLYMRYFPYSGAEIPGKWSASPDDSRLALKLFPGEGPPKSGERIRGNIYIFDLASQGLRLLVDGASPVWSPDSSRIAFLRESGLWVIEVATGAEEKLYANEGEYAVADTTWSPDGKQIAFSYGTVGMGGEAEKRLVNVNDRHATPKVVLPKTSEMWGAAWLRGGDRVLYVVAEKEPTAQFFYNIWTVDVSSQITTRMTTLANVSSFSVNGSHGDWIAFTGDFPYQVTDTYDLWLVDGSSGELKRLSRHPSGDIPHDAHWSPDGTQIIFQRPGQGIWTLDMQDGAERQIYPGNPGIPYLDVAVLSGG